MTLRRSSRARQKSTSIYDDAKKEQMADPDEEETMRLEDGEHSDANDDSDHSSSDEESDGESEDAVEDEEFAHSSKKRKSNTGSASPTTALSGSKLKKVTPKKVPVHVGKSDNKPKLQFVNNSTKTSKATPKAIRLALATLSKKYCTFFQENGKNDVKDSLVHQLLNIYKQPKTSSNLTSLRNVRKIGEASEYDGDMGYIPHLHALCKSIVQLHNSDPNKAQVYLINLIFRAVGGSSRSSLNPNDVDLEELDNEEWGVIVTDLVDEMRDTPLELVLVCSDPLGATHARDVDTLMGRSKDSADVASLSSVAVTASTLGVREFRKIYEDFWYVLAHTALEEGTMSLVDNHKKGDKSASTATRYDTEAVRNIISRISELVSVGQPDIRSATTISVLAMSQAVLDKTVLLNGKLDMAARQLKSAIEKSKKTNASTDAKVKSLEIQVDSLKRTNADLEDVVEALVIKGVFIHRYRDSDMFIRQNCLQALADMTCRRPDIFLSDKYLKYFGWMMSDKAELVRIAALSGLNRPFELVKRANEEGVDSGIDLSSMEHVVTKFLDRIVDCSIDIHVTVQEVAVKLLLSLLRNSFLDDIEDENMWSKINTLALDERGSKDLRRDALYFIMEQLEEFDDDADDDLDETQAKERKVSTGPSDRRTAARLDAIASWAAHTLTDGNVPIDKIKIHLVDYIIESLRTMPNHNGIATNWNAMIRAITDDKTALTAHGESAGDRTNVAKQRVLVQMLACATRLEVKAVASPEFLKQGLDIDEIDYNAEFYRDERKKVNKSSDINHETLSIALMKALPDLLDKFKSDSVVLQSLVCLPRYFLPSVFSLPQRKNDFLALLKIISEIYLQTTDEIVLTNAARSIAYVCDGNHARSNDARAQVTKLVTELRDRICSQLSQQDSPKSSKAKNRRRSSTESSAISIDGESALCNNLDRARILSKKVDFSSFLGDDFSSLEELCQFIAEGITRRLKSLQVARPIDDEETVATCKERWESIDENMVYIIPCIVRSGLAVILNSTTWRMHEVLHEEGLMSRNHMSNQKGYVSESDDEDMSDIMEDHELLRLRNHLISLVELCYDQFVLDEEDCSSLQVQWSNEIIEVAAQVGSDIRTLFMKEYIYAKSPLLHALAITDDSRLVGGYARFIRAKEQELRQMNISSDRDEENLKRARTLLLPICRSVAVNWKLGNRREAGIILSHIVGSGSNVSEIVTHLSRELKKIDSMRLLESHMASLRQSYEDWLENDPADIEDENPTDDMMARFEEEEQQHKGQFELIVQQAQRFSQSLGVRKLSNEQLVGPILLGFIREGIRFSFSESEDFMLGTRLSFLSIIIKYAHWIKKNKEDQGVIGEFLYEKELELRGHHDFQEVHEDDLLALLDFRKAIGLGESTVLNADLSTVGDATSTYSGARTPHSMGYSTTPGTALTSEEDDQSHESAHINGSVGSTAAARKSSRGSTGSSRISIGSGRSRMSTSVRSSLNPLTEVAEEDESSKEYESHSDDVSSSESPQKSRNKRSVSRSTRSYASRKSQSSAGDSTSRSARSSKRSYRETQTTFDGEAYSDSGSEF